MDSENSMSEFLNDLDFDEDIEIITGLFENEEGESIEIQENEMDSLPDGEDVILDEIPLLVFVNDDDIATVVTSADIVYLPASASSTITSKVLNCEHCGKAYQKPKCLENHEKVCKGIYKI